MEDATLRNDIYEVIYDLINANKSSYGASTTPSLYGGYPDTKTITFPNIIIQPIDVSESSYTIDTTRNVSSKSIIITIEIFSKKNKDLDIISDGVTNTLRNNKVSGMYLSGVSENTQFVSPNDLKLKSKILTFSYVRR